MLSVVPPASSLYAGEAFKWFATATTHTRVWQLRRKRSFAAHSTAGCALMFSILRHVMNEVLEVFVT